MSYCVNVGTGATENVGYSLLSHYQYCTNKLQNQNIPVLAHAESLDTVCWPGDCAVRINSEGGRRSRQYMCCIPCGCNACA